MKNFSVTTLHTRPTWSADATRTMDNDNVSNTKNSYPTEIFSLKPA